MMAFIVVTVVLGGVAIPASPAAWVNADGVVFAPIDPIMRRIAQSIEIDPRDRAIKLERCGRTVVLRIDKDAILEPDGTTYVRLANVVRGLGGSIGFDAVRKVVTIEMPPSQPVSTPTPFNAANPTVAPTTVFTPQPVSTPRPTVTGIPEPRRTPVPAIPSFGKP